jgi:hypothetical protein
MATPSIKNTFGDLRAISDNDATHRPVNSPGNPKLNNAIVRASERDTQCLSLNRCEDNRVYVWNHKTCIMIHAQFDFTGG